MGLGRGNGGDGRDGKREVNPIGELCMLLCMETNSGIEYYENLPLCELVEKLDEYGSVMDKRIAAIKRARNKK